MNIIITKDFIAGIFKNWNDAQAYIAQRPTDIVGFTHINNDLDYPFYLVQINHDQPVFVAYQDEDEALENEGGSILFTIEEDFIPLVAWTDQMGSIPHDHLVDEDEDEEGC